MKNLTFMQRKTLESVIISSVTEGFYLAGGTALFIRYNHRKSEDFDFFTYPETKFDVSVLQKKIDKIPDKIELLAVDKGTLIFLLKDIKFSFFEYKYNLLKPLVSEESLGVLSASDEDIACMKIVAIAQRGLKKDFYDLWFLMKKHSWTLGDMLTLMAQKYPRMERKIILKSIVYFEDAEENSYPDIDAIWQEVKTYFIEECKKILKMKSLK